jgi:ankyrin repeat protein
VCKGLIPPSKRELQKPQEQELEHDTKQKRLSARAAAAVIHHPLETSLDEWLNFAADGDEAALARGLENGQDPNAVDDAGVSALMRAARAGHDHIVLHLLAHNAEVDLQNGNGGSALMHAAVEGHAAIVSLLLFPGGASVDLRTVAGKTALFGAVIRGNVEIAKMLLDQGASPNISNNDGVTPLMRAAFAGDVAIARLLLGEYDAILDSVDNRGRTALHYAARNGAEDVVRLLLDDAYRRNSIQTEIDVDAPMSDGRTALHIAAQRGHGAIVEILLKMGANIGLEDGDGRTALDLAKDFVHVDVFRLLRNAHEPQQQVREDDENSQVDGVACSLFRLDLFASQGVVCTCGVSRTEHSAAALTQEVGK